MAEIIKIDDNEVSSIQPEELQEGRSSLSFFEFDAPIQKKIGIDGMILLITNIFTISTIVRNNYQFKLVVFQIIVDMLLGTYIYLLYQTAKNNDIISFDGKVTSCTSHGLPKINQYYLVTIFNEEKGRSLSFRYGTDVEEGKIMSIYMRKGTSIIEGENGPEIEEYITVKMGKQTASKGNKNKADSETIEDYLGN